MRRPNTQTRYFETAFQHSAQHFFSRRSRFPLHLPQPKLLQRTPKPPSTNPFVASLSASPTVSWPCLRMGRVVKCYDVAVGAHVSPSPSGEFQIVERLTNPTYYKPGTVIGPGVDNPLGTRWLGLNIKGFGIHGTNRPDSIGMNASHGCIRLKNSDVEDLFARVRVGDYVSLLAKSTEEVAQLFGGEPSPSKIASGQLQVARNQSSNTEDTALGSE